MNAVIDETGNKYGMITVLSKADRPSGRTGSFWNVRCECGKEWVIDRTKLFYGQESCAACAVLIRNKKKVQKNIGRKFGSLTIIKALEEYSGENNPARLYLCACDCGKNIKCRLAYLTSGKSSCGCEGKKKATRVCPKKYDSMVGKTFGDYVIESHDKRDSGIVVGRCRCGATKRLTCRHLLSGIVPKCKACAMSEKRKAFVKSFVGRKFGNLTAIEYAGKGKLGHRWLCECVCGNNPVVLEGNLIRGNSTQCEVCRNKANGERSVKDLAGMKFGMLTVIRRTGKNKSGNLQWECKCDCGETTVVSSSNLVRNHTFSCGCVISTGEILLTRYLRKNRIKFVKQKTFEGCADKRNLRFDFYLPDYGWCVECEGYQHYHPVDWFGGEEQFATQQRRDKIKSDFCKDNFIPLIRIHYSDYKEMDRVADSITACLKRLPSKKNNIKAGDPDTRHTTQAPI